MLIGYEMFLLAAEELNFSRAAERAFVTPQSLSDHIKRLEAHHHVTPSSSLGIDRGRGCHAALSITNKSTRI